jgi:2-C-methyl-D-erythritol 4-phosphate cytidylyltransferase / 2-C-methyl-D-erythritol 2,4-cyclodiphosphate synthase
VQDTVPRENFFEAQTPQAFRFQTIYDLHKRAEGMEFTDDAGICEAYGVKVAIVQGDKNNIKITTRDDFNMAEKLLTSSGCRVGIGFDVHKFGSPKYKFHILPRWLAIQMEMLAFTLLLMRY